MRVGPSPYRRPGVYAAMAAVGGLLASGCGGDGETPGARGAAEHPRTTLLQAADQGPDPFTASTVLTSDVAPGRGPVPDAAPGAAGTADAARAPRTVDGATPGLYGATQSLPSCDIEQQIRFLTADAAKAGAFARAAGVNQAGLADWLRGLTPVMLRADTRVTGHGYRDGAPAPYPAVLQAGTAVLVDAYGAPRVRCAGGNPLRTPAEERRADGDGHEGRAWDGYAPGRVIAVQPTVRTLDSLTVVNVVNESWLERAVGTTGDQDREPDVPPAYRPADRHVADSAVPDGSGGRGEQDAGDDLDGLLVGPVNDGAGGGAGEDAGEDRVDKPVE